MVANLSQGRQQITGYPFTYSTSLVYYISGGKQHWHVVWVVGFIDGKSQRRAAEMTHYESISFCGICSSTSLVTEPQFYLEGIPTKKDMTGFKLLEKDVFLSIQGFLPFLQISLNTECLDRLLLLLNVVSAPRNYKVFKSFMKALSSVYCQLLNVVLFFTFTQHRLSMSPKINNKPSLSCHFTPKNYIMRVIFRVASIIVGHTISIEAPQSVNKSKSFSIIEFCLFVLMLSLICGVGSQ